MFESIPTEVRFRTVALIDFGGGRKGPGGVPLLSRGGPDVCLLDS